MERDFIIISKWPGIAIVVPLFPGVKPMWLFSADPMVRGFDNSIGQHRSDLFTTKVWYSLLKNVHFTYNVVSGILLS